MFYVGSPIFIHLQYNLDYIAPILDYAYLNSLQKA